MQIVHVVRQFLPARGGLENAVFHLGREQVKFGHSVRVVTLNRIFCEDTTLADQDRIEGMEVRRIPYVGSRRYPIAPGVIKHISDADIVHVHGIDFFFDFLAVTSPFHRRRLVISTHGGFFHTRNYFRLKQLYFGSVTRLTIRRYALVAASSAHDAEQFGRLRADGLFTLMNGVDTKKFSSIARSGRPKQVIYFGRLAPNKNVSALLPIIAALRRLDPEWRLVIAGRSMGVSAADLMACARELGVGDATRVFVSPTDVELRELVAASSVFCSPSSYEGFGIAAVEAISGGLVVALSDIPAHRATIDATGCGLLVDFAAPDEAAELILEAFRQQGHRAARAPQEQDLARLFSWENVARKSLDAYRDVLGEDMRLLLRTRVHVRRQAEAVEEICNAVRSSTPMRVAFVNAHLALQAARSREVEDVLTGFTLLNDGVGVDLASRLLFGRKFPANLNGTDFTPALLDRLPPGCRIFLLGARAEVIAAAAAEHARRWPQLKVVGHHHGFFDEGQEGGVADLVRAAKPDLVLVGMGCPRQELWLARNIPDVCPVGIGVGALFDFETATVRRAPAFVRKVRFEWLFRLVQEPRRLSGRYLAGNAAFLWGVARQWLNGARA